MHSGDSLSLENFAYQACVYSNYWRHQTSNIYAYAYIRPQATEKEEALPMELV